MMARVYPLAVFSADDMGQKVTIAIVARYAPQISLGCA